MYFGEISKVTILDSEKMFGEVTFPISLKGTQIFIELHLILSKCRHFTIYYKCIYIIFSVAIIEMQRGVGLQVLDILPNGF